MNQKDKDILKANPVLGESDFAQKLKEWAAKEAKKELEQSNATLEGEDSSSP